MYKPLPNNLTIRSSKIHGLGLFATKNIPMGTFLGVSHIKHPHAEGGWIRTPLGGFYNHSESPNCHLVEEWYGLVEYRTTSKNLITISDIRPGEEITCYYTVWKFNDDFPKKEPLNNWLGL